MIYIDQNEYENENNMLSVIYTSFGQLKKVLTILLVSFYLSGTMFLPMGDFSIIKDLPDMYRHCRDTEDRDLSVFEFFTEHLSGIGQLLEGIEHEDDKDDAGDKPHAPVSYHGQQQISCIVYQVKTTIQKPIVSITDKLSLIPDKDYVSPYLSFILRPPIG